MQLCLFEELDLDPKDELIEVLLRRGSGFVDGKKRIYEYALKEPNTKVFANFLKNEYGIGGRHSCATEPNTIHSEDHDSNGIQYEGIDRNGELVKRNLTWVQVAEKIMEMVRKDVYL